MSLGQDFFVLLGCEGKKDYIFGKISVDSPRANFMVFAHHHPKVEIIHTPGCPLEIFEGKLRVLVEPPEIIQMWHDRGYIINPLSSTKFFKMGLYFYCEDWQEVILSFLNETCGLVVRG